MRAPPTIQPRHVLITGGGIAAVELLMALTDLGDRQLRLELVCDSPTFVLRPQVVGEPWGGPALDVDLELLCRAFGARFRLGEVVAVDAQERQVRLADGSRLGYEELVMAIGARLRSPYPGVGVLGFDPVPPAVATRGDGAVAIVVPPGQRWALPAYELAVLVAGPPGRRDVEVVTWEHEPLEAFGPRVARPAGDFLRAHGVRVSTGRPLPPGSDVSALADMVVALPLAAGPGLPGLPCDQDGFVPVDAWMAVLGAGSVHAVGDVTSGQVKQGGLAAQQADVAAVGIVADAGGGLPRTPYAPVLRGRLTVPGGEGLYLRRALDASDPGVASTAALWRAPGVVCARRLSEWLARVPGEVQACSIDHVARPGAVRT